MHDWRESQRLYNALADPDDSFNRVVARSSEVLSSNRGRVGCLSSRLCLYSVPNSSNAWHAFYDIVHYNRALRHWIRVVHSPDLGIPSVTILP